MDYEKKKEKYNKIISDLNRKLTPFVDKAKREIDKQNERENPLKTSTPPPCGTIQHNNRTANEEATLDNIEEINKFNDIVNNIIDDIRKEPHKFGDVQVEEVGGNVGQGQGEFSTYIKVTPTMAPWVKEITAAIGASFTKGKTRYGVDYEELATGYEGGYSKIRKPKTTHKKKEKELYILLDTSGSMEFYTWKDVPYIKILGNYIPTLSKYYGGELWLCDDCALGAEPIPMKAIPLRQIRKSTMDSIDYSGGGTRFTGAWARLKQIEKERKATNPNYEMTVVQMSDFDLFDNEWEKNKPYYTSKCVFVTAVGGKEMIPDFIFEDKDKFKVILIDIEK